MPLNERLLIRRCLYLSFEFKETVFLSHESWLYQGSTILIALAMGAYMIGHNGGCRGVRYI